MISDNSGWKGGKYYNKYNVIKPACIVEDAVEHIIQVHQTLVLGKVQGEVTWFSNSQTIATGCMLQSWVLLWKNDLDVFLKKTTGMYVPATWEPLAPPRQ